MAVIVMLCTNDWRNGVTTGKVSAVQIEDAIDLQWGEIGSEPKYGLSLSELKLSRKEFPILGSRDWAGNWCWTAVRLDEHIAVNLLNYLSHDDRWHCEGGECNLTDAFAEGKVTKEILEAAL